MLPNGQCVVIDMALRAVDCALLRRHREALLLGTLREDVARLPLTNRVFEHASPSHFYGCLPGGYVPLLWPGARWKASHLLRKALAAQREGRLAAACVQLGRACHVLTDMACPVHAHRVMHEADPFEWYVEAHAQTLAQLLPVPPSPPLSSAPALVASLAAHSRRFTPDRTHNPFGRALRHMGLLHPVPKAEIARQAEALIPVAAAHATTLFILFLGKGATHSDDSGQVARIR